MMVFTKQLKRNEPYNSCSVESINNTNDESTELNECLCEAIYRIYTLQNKIRKVMYTSCLQAILF